MTQKTRLYGVDGCRGGWVVAEADTAMHSSTFRLIPDLSLLFKEAGPHCLIAIDIPIGLPRNEPRACDIQARQLLGWPRRNSVFPPPARDVLESSTFPEAQRINRNVLCRGISKQTWCIVPKIHEVDVLMKPEMQLYIRETHPEVTFAQLSGGPMLHNKKTPEGRAERIAVLNAAGVAVSDEMLRLERSRLPTIAVAPDDMVDALACLVTAEYIDKGRSKSLGRVDQRDARELLMEIVTCVVSAPVARA